MSNFEAQYQKALAAAGLSPTETRKRLEDIAFQEAKKFGPGGYATADNGARLIWSIPQKSLRPISEMSNEELAVFGKVPAGLVPWLAHPDKAQGRQAAQAHSFVKGACDSRYNLLKGKSPWARSRSPLHSSTPSAGQ